MPLHGYRCMHCDYSPIVGGGKGDVKAVDLVKTPCKCPSDALALPDCPIYRNFQKHILDVHSIRWG